MSISVNLWWKPRLVQRLKRAHIRYPGHYLVRFTMVPLAMAILLLRPLREHAA